MRRDWSPAEVREIVADYFRMLRKELADEKYSKIEHIRGLSPRLDSRTRGSIEFKHENITAVLIELDRPFVNGYKPALNYQGILRAEVERFLGANPDLDTLFRSHASRAPGTPQAIDLDALEEPPPVLQARKKTARESAAFGPTRTDYFERESRNRALGTAGEELVYRFEVARLLQAGADRLSRSVDWVARTRGDGIGYDVHSYEADGRERLIEVKTTTRGATAPFFVTHGELNCSLERSQEYQLYRVYAYPERPRLFRLVGRIDDAVDLSATEYRVRLRPTA